MLRGVQEESGSGQGVVRERSVVARRGQGGVWLEVAIVSGVRGIVSGVMAQGYGW